MTTRAKRSAKSAKIEALVTEDRELLQGLLKESLEEFLEADMTDTLGARSGERTGERLGYRAGYYSRGLVTRISKLELRVPRDREGRFSTAALVLGLTERWRPCRSSVVWPSASQTDIHRPFWSSAWRSLA